MHVQSKALASVLIASTLSSAYGAFTSSSPPSRRVTVKASQSPLFTVIDSKSDEIAATVVIDSKSDEISATVVIDSKSDEIAATERNIEEKAWQIIKDDDNETLKVIESVNVTIDPPNVEAILDETDLMEAILDETDLVAAIEKEAIILVEEMADDTCEVNDMGNAVDEICADESKLAMVKSSLKGVVRKTLGLVRTGGDDDLTDKSSTDFDIIDFEDVNVPEGELLERGWEERGNSSALRRNAEVWKFALSCVFKALKPKKLRKKGASEEEIQEAKTQAATFIRNGLLRLGPSFVKLVSNERTSSCNVLNITNSIPYYLIGTSCID
jgi:hypothetical protein